MECSEQQIRALTLKVSVVPSDGYADLNPADNNISKLFMVSPDGCGRWSRKLINSPTISANTTNNISISINDNRIGFTEAGNARDQWNGIETNIKIAFLGSNVTNPTCTVITEEIADTSIAGFFRANTSSGNFSGGAISLSRAEWEKTNNRQYVITHEIGHLLGMGHPHEASWTAGGTPGGNPSCHDLAVMQYPNLNTNYVTLHDRTALALQY